MLIGNERRPLLRKASACSGKSTLQFNRAKVKITGLKYNSLELCFFVL
ncbi:MAG: hypothetical protein ACE3JN_04870 [Ectobacillus sp.]